MITLVLLCYSPAAAHLGPYQYPWPRPNTSSELDPMNKRVGAPYATLHADHHGLEAQGGLDQC